MFSSVISAAIDGISCFLIRVEVDVSDGLPGLTIVGAPGIHQKETAERVRVSLKNMGIRLPPTRITVNLAPAEVPKRGSSFDLPIAAGILACLNRIPPSSLENAFLSGELGLDGSIRPVRGILPMVRCAARAGILHCIVPADNVPEGAVTKGVRVAGPETLRDFIRYMCAGERERERICPPLPAGKDLFLQKAVLPSADFLDVHGQKGVKRVLEIAAAGFHNVLMVGPPGTGKSMMARCLPGIMPPLTREESLEVSDIYSISGQLPHGVPLITQRPFLSPHHSITRQALTGGGLVPVPGVLSLAHRGVLFLDELPEFDKDTLNALRQPLEDHVIEIARSTGVYRYPARCLLVAASNMCRCGNYPDRSRCTCTASEIARYRARIPGPVLDRIDLCVNVPRVPVRTLMIGAHEEPSARIRERVLRAWEMQKKRFAGTPVIFNGDMDAASVMKYCRIGADEERLLKRVFESMHLSARAFHRTLRVARTIADLGGQEEISGAHIAEAVGYRITDREDAQIG